MTEQDFKAYLKIASKEERLALIWLRDELEDTRTLRIGLEEQEKRNFYASIQAAIELPAKEVNEGMGTIFARLLNFESKLNYFRLEIDELSRSFLALRQKQLEEDRKIAPPVKALEKNEKYSDSLSLDIATFGQKFGAKREDWYECKRLIWEQSIAGNQEALRLIAAMRLEEGKS